MARKLTAQQQTVYKQHIKTISQVLPKDQRGFAPQVASKLVRMEPGSRTRKAVDELLEPYGKPSMLVRALVDEGVMRRVTKEPLAGTYAIVGLEDEEEAEGAPEAAPAPAHHNHSGAARRRRRHEVEAHQEAENAAAVHAVVEEARKAEEAEEAAATPKPRRVKPAPRHAKPLPPKAPEAKEPEKGQAPVAPRAKAPMRPARKPGVRAKAASAKPKPAPKAPALPFSPLKRLTSAFSKLGERVAKKPAGEAAAPATAPAARKPKAPALHAPLHKPFADKPPVAKTAPKAAAPAPEPKAAPIQAPAEQPAPAEATECEQAQPRKVRFESIPQERKQTPELLELRAQIIGLEPRMWLNGWLLSHPRALDVYRHELTALSQALQSDLDPSAGELTKRELSYKLFGREKFLDLNGDGRKLLRAMGLDGLVRYRKPANSELLMHVPHRKPSMRIVLSENLDPWLNMREHLYKSDTKVLGVHVDGVVFGNGWASSQPDKFQELVRGLGAEHLELLYWGDLDRSGLRALASLTKQAAEASTGCVVKPFMPAYKLMAERAHERWNDAGANEQTQQPPLEADEPDLVCAHLEEPLATYVRHVLDQGRLIPQEIVTLEDL